MSDEALSARDPEFPSGSKVRLRKTADEIKPENAGPIGEVIEAGPSDDPTKVFVTWPSGRDAWESRSSLEKVANAESDRLQPPLEG